MRLLQQMPPIDSLWLTSVLHGASFLYHEPWNIETWNWSTTILDYSVSRDRKINMGGLKLDLGIFCRFQSVMIFKSDFLARSKIGWYSNQSFLSLWILDVVVSLISIPWPPIVRKSQFLPVYLVAQPKATCSELLNTQ